MNIYDDTVTRGRRMTIDERLSIRRNCEIWGANVSKLDNVKEMKEFLEKENYIFNYLHESYYYQNADTQKQAKHQRIRNKTQKVRNY